MEGTTSKQERSYCQVRLNLCVSYVNAHQFSGTWRLEDKAGMPLDEIHEHGHVPLCESIAYHLLSPR
jgi:hypothetical protein